MRIKPKAHLGQNFLQDDEVLQKIIRAADLKPSDVVLEVGPGTGVLTKELLKAEGKVIAIEKDERLFEILSSSLRGAAGDEAISPRGKEIASLTRPTERLQSFGRVARKDEKLTLLNQDILKFHLDKYIQGPYKVVANIPYYLTSKLFQYFLEQKNKPELLVLMVQKEVGLRVVASPGSLSILGISVQIYADVEIIANVSRKSFWPEPEVDSVILKITPGNKYPEIKDKKLFFSIVKRAFSGKRKQIKNTLGDVKVLNKAGIDLMLRPQDLSIEDWIRLYRAIDKSLLGV